MLILVVELIESSPIDMTLKLILPLIAISYMYVCMYVSVSQFCFLFVLFLSRAVHVALLQLLISACCKGM